MVRESISAAQLYAVLDREYRAVRVCDRCRVPLPFRRDPPDEASANWALGTPTECPNGCHLLIAELMVSLWPRYDIK